MEVVQNEELMNDYTWSLEPMSCLSWAKAWLKLGRVRRDQSWIGSSTFPLILPMSSWLQITAVNPKWKVSLIDGERVSTIVSCIIWRERNIITGLLKLRCNIFHLDDNVFRRGSLGRASRVSTIQIRYIIIISIYLVIIRIILILKRDRLFKLMKWERTWFHFYLFWDFLFSCSSTPIY